MINLNAIQSPYDNLRPKSFFSARKGKMVEDIMHNKSGKVYNPRWMGKKKIKVSNTMSYDANMNELKIMLPWILFLSMAIINLLIAVL